MSAIQRHRERIPRCLAVAVITIVAITMLVPPTTEAQGSLAVEFCKKVNPTGGGDLFTRECGNKFVASDAYIGLVVRLRQVNDDVRVALELLDPDQASVWTYQTEVRVQPGYYFPEWWVYGILAVTADAAALASENLRLTAGMIKIEGKPVRERTGDWTLRVRLRNSPPLPFKFTLQAAP